MEDFKAGTAELHEQQAISCLKEAESHSRWFTRSHLLDRESTRLGDLDGRSRDPRATE
jgi:hypothetical protein